MKISDGRNVVLSRFSHNHLGGSPCHGPAGLSAYNWSPRSPEGHSKSQGRAKQNPKLGGKPGSSGCPKMGVEIARCNPASMLICRCVCCSCNSFRFD